MLSCLLGACAADPNQAPASGVVDPLPAASYPQIAVSPTLQDWLVFAPATVTPSNDSMPMHVSVPFRSIYDDAPLTIQYRFVFLDVSHQPVGLTGFRRIRVEPRLQDYLEANALDTTAEDWRLEVRPAR